MVNDQIWLFFTITEQKSSKDILPSWLLSALSSIAFRVCSSRSYFICLLISRRSLTSIQFLFALSYFLNIAAIYFLFSFRYGLHPIAFMNQLKLIPPASSRSNSAIISQTVFLFGLNPFCVKSSVKSFGRRTPIPVESYVSNTYFKSITSSIFNWLVTQICGSKCSRSFLLNRTRQRSVSLSGRPSLFQGLYPNFSYLLFDGVLTFANDLVLCFSLLEFIVIQTNPYIIIKFNQFKKEITLSEPKYQSDSEEANIYIFCIFQIFYQQSFVFALSISLIISDSMIRQYDYLFKVVLVGNSSVGKSSILRRFADDSFQESYLATIGVDFRFKSITVNGDVVKLQIWDTAGQERFRTITGAYYKGAHAIIIVYDITKQQSFKDIQQFWIGEIEKYSIPNVQLFVIGNKLDTLQQLRKVKAEHAEGFCSSHNIIFKEVSAKSGQNIGQAFQKVGESLTRIYPKQQKKNQRNPVIDEITKKKKQFQLQSASESKKNTSCC